MTEFERGARVTLQIQGAVWYQTDDTVTVHLFDEDGLVNQYKRETYPLSSVISVLPPIQKPGARVDWTDGCGGVTVATVVSYDQQAQQYVLREDEGGLAIALDQEVSPHVEPGGGEEIVEAWVDELARPDAAAAAEHIMTVHALGEWPVGPRDPIGTELGAEDVAARLPTGPNCKHTYMDAICDAEGCKGEMPF
jgi:hypothetical protein